MPVKRRKFKPLKAAVTTYEQYKDALDSHVVGPSDPENPPKMTEADRLKLAEMTRAMSEEEQMVVLENIPAELCVKRIELELKKARAFGNAVEKAFRILED